MQYPFVAPDREDAEDVYLSSRYMRELMHGDRVAVRSSGKDRRGRPEGSLVEVLERNTSSVVGKYVQERGVAFVLPENPRILHRILVPPDGVGRAKPGQVVLIELTAQPTRHTQPIGRVVSEAAMVWTMYSIRLRNSSSSKPRMFTDISSDATSQSVLPAM